MLQTPSEKGVPMLRPLLISLLAIAALACGMAATIAIARQISPSEPSAVKKQSCPPKGKDEGDC